MRLLKTAAAFLFIFAAFPLAVRADDFGPRRDVAQVRSDAQRLLAHRVRDTGTDPTKVTISDVVVVKDQALLSWDSGKQHGVMGLVRFLDRWWDALDDTRPNPKGYCWRGLAAYPLTPSEIAEPPAQRSLTKLGLSQALVDAATAHNVDMRDGPADCRTYTSVADVRSHVVVRQGAIIDASRTDASGYYLLITYAPNDAFSTLFSRIYGRAPTQAEILPNPAPPRGWGGPTDIFYFDLELNGKKAVTFQPGTKIDIWFPFVLDDQLSYRLSYVMDGQFSKSIHGTIFDNILHFELPQFVIAPPNALQAEVEGFW